MAIALHVGVSARSEAGAARRFGASRSDVLSGVYAEHYDRLMGFFVRRTRDRLLAEDLTHDTIVRFVRSCDTFDVSRPAWPYLKTTANNVLIDHLRRAERQVDMDVEEELDEEECLEPTPDSLMVLREMLSEALDLLPDRQRIAVDLRYERGWSVPDAAEFLGVSAGTFGQLLFRARQTMKDYLDSVGPGVHGVVLPALLALRWRWRTWSAKGRGVAQTPVSAMSMEAVASVVVAASLGLAVVVTAPDALGAPIEPRMERIAIPSPGDELRAPDWRRPTEVVTRAPAVHQTESQPVEPLMITDPNTSAPLPSTEVPAQAGIRVDDGQDSFIISHEVEGRTGVPLGAGGNTGFSCNTLLGVVCGAQTD